MSKFQVSAATRRDSAAARPVSAARPPSEAAPHLAASALLLGSATRAILVAGAAETRDSQAAVCRADSRVVEARHSEKMTADRDSSRAVDVAPADRRVTSPGTVPTRTVS